MYACEVLRFRFSRIMTHLLEKGMMIMSGNGNRAAAESRQMITHTLFSLMEMRRVTHSSIAGRHTSE